MLLNDQDIVINSKHVKNAKDLHLINQDIKESSKQNFQPLKKVKSGVYQGSEINEILIQIGQANSSSLCSLSPSN
jgi:hypothetical protein